jgi:hypothetical protein
MHGFVVWREWASISDFQQGLARDQQERRSKAELRQYGIADFIGERSRLDPWPLKDDIATLQIRRHPPKAALAKGFCKPLHRQLVSATNIYAAQQGYPDPSATGFECFRFCRRASHFMDQRTILNDTATILTSRRKSRSNFWLLWRSVGPASTIASANMPGMVVFGNGSGQ